MSEVDSQESLDVAKVYAASKDLGLTNDGPLTKPILKTSSSCMNFDSVNEMARGMVHRAISHNNDGALRKLSQAIDITKNKYEFFRSAIGSNAVGAMDTMLDTLHSDCGIQSPVFGYLETDEVAKKLSPEMRAVVEKHADFDRSVDSGDETSLFLMITDTELDSGVIDHIPSFTNSPSIPSTPDELLEHHLGRRGHGAHVSNALRGGANPNLRDGQGVPMVIRASAYPHDLDNLYQHGADLNAPDPEGNTALHFAVAGNQVGSVEKLLELGADPFIKERHGLIPADLAKNDASEIIKKLYSTASENPLLKHFDGHLDEDGDFISTLSRRDRNEVKRELQVAYDAGWDIRVRDENGETLLMAYASANQTSALDEGIRLGVDVNAQDRDGETALMKSWKSDALELLLKNGANPNLADHKKRTALHHSGNSSWSVEYRSLLLNYGADPNAQDQDGDTLLHNLVKQRRYDWSLEKAGVYAKGSTEHYFDGPIRMLVEHGADPTIKNKDGLSAGEMYLAQEGKDPTTHMVVDAHMTRDKLQTSLVATDEKRKMRL